MVLNSVFSPKNLQSCVYNISLGITRFCFLWYIKVLSVMLTMSYSIMDNIQNRGKESRFSRIQKKCDFWGG